MSLTLYYLLDCLYCNLHRKIFWAFFCLHGKSSTSTAWKNEIHRCVLCVRGVCPAISFSYSASAPKLLAAGFGLLLALNMSRRSVWVHLVREECSKKNQSPGVQTMSQDKELDWGAPPTCVGKPAADPWAPWHLCLAQVVLEWWYFLGIYMVLCLVFYIPLLREQKHFSSVAGNLTPRLFVDVCPGACLSLGAVTLLRLSRPFKGKHQIVLLLLAHFFCCFALAYFWW